MEEGRRERGGGEKLGNEWTEGGMGLICDIISLSYDCTSTSSSHLSLGSQ